MAEIKQSAKGLHIGFIMDGNGRWAQRRGLPRTAGHTQGCAGLSGYGQVLQAAGC